jgi:pimeloyl-ACP methyl ester carboxylesterase
VSVPRSRDHPRRIVLDDGRLLAFDEYGDPAGEPVFSFHGGISSRLDAAPMAAAARSLGVRLISPDRPGTGYSDFAPDRTLLDWPRDVTGIADALGLGRFAVMGWSLGGQYAAACAYALPRRVTRAALLAGVVPFEAVRSRSGLTWLDRGLLALSRWAPPLAAAGLWFGVARRSPERLQRTVERESAAVDRTAMRSDRSPTAMAEAIQESMRAGARGVIREYRIFGAPWGFDLAEIQVEVGIWQGDDDTMVPVSDAEALADRIPRSRLVICPGEGHISLRPNRGEEVIGWLAERR